MPVYEQSCPSCGYQFDVVVLSASSTSPRPCLRCGEGDTVQLFSRFHSRKAERDFEVKRGPAHNPFASLTLEHIRGEDGKPITVHSERELRAAEKKYNFIHAASWGLEKEPPQHDPGAGQLHRHYAKKWNRDEAAYAPDKVAEAMKECGPVASPDETLVDRPNA